MATGYDCSVLSAQGSTALDACTRSTDFQQITLANFQNKNETLSRSIGLRVHQANPHVRFFSLSPSANEFGNEKICNETA